MQIETPTMREHLDAMHAQRALRMRREGLSYIERLRSALNACAAEREAQSALVLAGAEIDAWHQIIDAAHERTQARTQARQ